MITTVRQSLSWLGCIIHRGLLSATRLALSPSPSDDDFSCPECHRSSWSQLPSLPLTHIFSLLPDKDRLSAALTCKAWLDVFSLPCLWSHCRVEVCGEEAAARRDVAFVRRHANHIRHITLRVVVEGGAGEEEACYKHVKRVVEACVAGGVQLVEVCLLLPLAWPPAHVPARAALASLACLLEKQRHLSILDLSGGGMAEAQVAALVASACRNSGPSLRVVGVEWWWCGPLYREGPYVGALARLRQVQVLRVPFAGVSGELVLGLAERCWPHLTQIHLLVNTTTCRQGLRSLADLNWAQVRARCPHLRVSVNLDSLCHSSQIQAWLPPHLPLNRVKVWVTPEAPHHASHITDHVSQYTVLLLFTHLAKCYAHILEKVVVRSGGHVMVWHGLDLAHMVASMPRLASVAIDNIYFTPETCVALCRGLNNVTHANTNTNKTRKRHVVLPVATGGLAPNGYVSEREGGRLVLRRMIDEARRSKQWSYRLSHIRDGERVWVTYRM